MSSTISPASSYEEYGRSPRSSRFALLTFLAGLSIGRFSGYATLSLSAVSECFFVTIQNHTERQEWKNVTEFDTVLNNDTQQQHKWKVNDSESRSPPPSQENCTDLSKASTTLLINPGKTIIRPLPRPVIVVGMPKAGTTTIESFFRCAGYKTSHYKCKKGVYCGKCISKAVSLGHLPLASCGGYDVWAEMGVALPAKGLCHMPQVQYLQEIHDEAPAATFIMNKRNVTNWIKSMRSWNLQNPLPERFVGCRNATLLNASDDKSLEKYFMDHVQAIRDFVDRNPTHALVEVDIEDPNAGCMMSELFGVDSKCWGQANSGLNNPRGPQDNRIKSKKKVSV